MHYATKLLQGKWKVWCIAIGCKLYIAMFVQPYGLLVVIHCIGDGESERVHFVEILIRISLTPPRWLAISK